MDHCINKFLKIVAINMTHQPILDTNSKNSIRKKFHIWKTRFQQEPVINPVSSC